MGPTAIIACVLGCLALSLVLHTGSGCDNYGGILGTVPPLTAIDAGLVGGDHGAVAWGDYDSDGDLDLAVCCYYVYLYRNDGATFTDVGLSLPRSYKGSLAWGDYDGDGDLDLVVAGDGSTRVYRNDGGAFVDINVGLPEAQWSSVAWGDCDNDGDLDLALAGYSNAGTWAAIYRNNGNDTFTDIAAPLVGVSSCSLAWADYDNDGDLDLMVAGSRELGPDSCVLYVNSNGAFSASDPGLYDVDRCSVAWGDYDSDGVFDIALAGHTMAGSHPCRSEVYRGDGTIFQIVEAGLPDVDYGCLAWGDSDLDGYADLMLSGTAYDMPGWDIYPSGGLYLGGSDGFSDADARLRWHYTCALAWGDHDDDGDLDLVLIGSYSGDVYRNNCVATNARPSVPTGLSVTANGSVGPYDVLFEWDPSTDAETPAPGLTYNLRVLDESSGAQVMPGMSLVGGADDGKRLVPAVGNVQKAGPPSALRRSWTLRLPAGTYRWSVQAIDAAFLGSRWAAEQVVSVPP